MAILKDLQQIYCSNRTKIVRRAYKLNNCYNKFHILYKVDSLYGLCLFWADSLRAASWSNCVSHSSAGSWMYRTTEPRMKQFLIDSMWGYLSGSVTLMSVSLILRNWSTECSVPQILKSFLSSTTTSLPTNDLKNE